MPDNKHGTGNFYRDEQDGKEVRKCVANQPRGGKRSLQGTEDDVCPAIGWIGQHAGPEHQDDGGLQDDGGHEVECLGDISGPLQHGIKKQRIDIGKKLVEHEEDPER